MPARLVFILVLFSHHVFAQTATLRGQITDETGAVIPGAKVTVTGPSGLVKTTTAGTDGSYSFTGLPLGNYAVQASAPELILPQPATISLKTGQTLNLQLKIASTAQQVTVQETAAPAVNADPANNASALVLRGEDLQALADDPEDLAADHRLAQTAAQSS
jgi:Carboxypeptidase regulatory-like domain